MRDSFPGKKESERDRKGILQVQSGRGVEGPGWRRQRFGERNSVYVVTPESCTTYTRENPPPPSLSLPHHIGSVPVTPYSEGVRAHGAQGQGVSTYGIWPGPGE